MTQLSSEATNMAESKREVLSLTVVSSTGHHKPLIPSLLSIPTSPISPLSPLSPPLAHPHPGRTVKAKRRRSRIPATATVTSAAALPPAQRLDLLRARHRSSSLNSLDVDAAPPHKPLPFLWRCHVCRQLYPLSATRRCISDGHVFCSGLEQPSVLAQYQSQATANAANDNPLQVGIETQDIHKHASFNSHAKQILNRRRENRGLHRRTRGKNKAKRHKHATRCGAEFDYAGWKAWGDWKRNRIVRRSLNKIGVAGFTYEDVEQGGCFVCCDFPSECRWSAFHADMQVGPNANDNVENAHYAGHENDPFQNAQPELYYPLPFNGPINAAASANADVLDDGDSVESRLLSLLGSTKGILASPTRIKIKAASDDPPVGPIAFPASDSPPQLSRPSEGNILNTLLYAQTNSSEGKKWTNYLKWW